MPKNWPFPRSGSTVHVLCPEGKNRLSRYVVDLENLDSRVHLESFNKSLCFVLWRGPVGLVPREEACGEGLGGGLSPQVNSRTFFFFFF